MDYEGLDSEERACMRNLLKKLFLASSAGLISGALVGMVEASYLFHQFSEDTCFTQLLYGAIGVGMGGACGVDQGPGFSSQSPEKKLRTRCMRSPCHFGFSRRWGW